MAKVLTLTDDGRLCWQDPCVLVAGCEGDNSSPVAMISGCSATLASGGTMTLTATSTDADGDSLTHTWSTTLGTLSATSGDSVTLAAPQIAEGESAQSGTVTLATSDGTDTATATCDFTVQPAQNPCVSTPAIQYRTGNSTTDSATLDIEADGSSRVSRSEWAVVGVGSNCNLTIPFTLDPPIVPSPGSGGVFAFDPSAVVPTAIGAPFPTNASTLYPLVIYLPGLGMDFEIQIPAGTTGALTLHTYDLSGSIGGWSAAPDIDENHGVGSVGRYVWNDVSGITAITGKITGGNTDPDSEFAHVALLPAGTFGFACGEETLQGSACCKADGSVDFFDADGNPITDTSIIVDTNVCG